MKTILEELYDSYNNFVPDPATQAEVDNAHQALIRCVEKPERRLVLRIIDNKDLIAGARARESFECGFWLAWRLCTQLNMIDNGRLLATQIVKPPHALPKPSITDQGIPKISECFISNFAPAEKGQTDNEIPRSTVTPAEEIELPKTSAVPEEIAKTGTQTEPFSEPPAKEVVLQQSSQSTAPQMGDTRVVNGQKQSYFLGFSWIDDNNEPNQGAYVEDTYENGNKIGSMGGGTFVDGEGDINKMVGTMD